MGRIRRARSTPSLARLPRLVRLQQLTVHDHSQDRHID
jgi:hypothetical protein